MVEFTAAMHLVVLRRNNIPLPKVLPACLNPSGLQHSSQKQQQISQQEPPEADLLHLNDDDEDNIDATLVAAGISKTARMDKNVMNISNISTSSQVKTYRIS